MAEATSCSRAPMLPPAPMMATDGAAPPVAIVATHASDALHGLVRPSRPPIDLGSSPAPFKRLRPFKESAAQQLLKPA